MTPFRVAGFLTDHPRLCVVIALAILLLIHACDNAGRVYPAECTSTVTPDVQVEYVTTATMIRLQRSFGYHESLNGLHARIGDRQFIWVNVEHPDGSARSDAERQNTLRHELCHAIMGAWHG